MNNKTFAFSNQPGTLAGQST